MSPILVSRILLVLFIINEVIVVARSKPGEIQTINVPVITRIAAILFVVPFFFVLEYPEWIGWIIVALQGLGLLIEVLAEIQLARARSFAISAQAATQVQRGGMYRFLENPIYVGILLQVFAWALWMPVALIATALFFMVIRTMVASERAYLQETHQTSHRGIDSFMWN